MKVLLLISVISLALSACPNSCSGHGSCKNNVCECVTFNGEPQYTGNDCSLLACPSGFSWISRDEVVMPYVGDIQQSVPRQLDESVTEGDAEGTEETEEPTTTPEPPTPLPDPTFNQTNEINGLNVTLPFSVFGGVLKCNKDSINVIYYNETGFTMDIAGVNTSDSEISYDWPNCKVEMKRNDISLMSIVKFHEYSGGDVVSDMWMTAELFNKYEFNTTELNLACIYQEKDPVEFITAVAVTDIKADEVTLKLDTPSLPSSCYVLATEKGKEVKFEESDAFQLFYYDKGYYYFGTKTTDKATFVAEKINEKGGLTFKEESGMVSFARNLIPGLEVTIYYIPISQGYVIIEKRIIKSIDIITTTSSSSSSGEGRLLADDPSKNTQEVVITFNELLPVRPGYMYQIVVDTNKGTHVAKECSDNGLCDRTTGQCQCFPGFSGSACQILTNCPNNCNNNGRCVPYSKVLNREIKNGIAGIYKTSESDLLYGCLCDPGHRGVDCSLTECPSSEDPQGATNVWTKEKDTVASDPYRHPVDAYEHRDCSGRGICNYDTGSCTCFDGFKGTACEEMSLSTM